MKGEALHLEGLNDAGLEHRDTQAGRTCVCVCVCHVNKPTALTTGMSLKSGK